MSDRSTFRFRSSGRFRPCRRASQVAVVLAVSVAALVSTMISSATGDAAPGQPDVVVVGDSLTGGNVSYIAPTLRDAGIAARVEGLSARRIAVSFSFKGYRDAGIERIRSLRADGVDPDLWVVQLGTNDLGAVQNCGCTDRRAFARSLIDGLLAEIGPDEHIAWVTLVDFGRPDIAAAFNIAVEDRAIRSANLDVIRWDERAATHRDWFLDDVHPDAAGIVRFTDMYVTEIRRLLDMGFDPIPQPQPQPQPQPWRPVSPAPAERRGFLFDS